jgi:protein SCO1/2
MKRFAVWMWILAGTAAILSAQGRFFQGPAGNPASLAPEQLKGIGFDQKLDEQLPLDLTFRDETGRSVRLGEFFGSKPVMIVPVYYECPMLCSQTLQGVVGSLKAVSFNAGAEFEVIAVSFDPTETPAQAAKRKDMYARKYGRAGAEKGFHFLTGDEKAVKRLMAAMGFRYAWDAKSKQYAHAAGIMITTPEGRISRVFYGIEFAPRDLRLGLIEAADRKIATPVDQVLLYCFHYDPATGKYSTIVMNVLRLAAGATVLMLSGMVLLFIRRERSVAHRAS